MKPQLFIWMVAFWAAIGSAPDATAQTSLKPVITNIQPAAAPVGATITITGNNFAPVAAQNVVYFGPVTGPVLAATATTLTVRVPTGGGSGVPLTVTNRATRLTGSSLVSAVPRFRVLFAGGPLSSGSYRRFDVPLRVGATDLATGDFNGDGLPDLACTTGFGGLAVVLNQGNGTFGPLLAVTANIQPFDLAVGDLNGDGNLDIATNNIWSRDISVIYGNGQGGFATPINIAASNLNRERMVIADLDGDGYPDILFIEQNQAFQNNVMAIFPRANGTFDGPLQLTTPQMRADLGWLDAADFNGDGRLDVAFATQSGGPAGFTILLSPASVATQPFTQEFTATSPSYRLIIARATDFNNDGRPDVVAASGNGTPIGAQIWLRNATGTGFDAPVSNLTSPPYRFDLGTADLDGDGNVDVFSTADNGGNSSLLLQTGTGTAALNNNSPTYTAPVLSNPNGSRRVVSADFNGDGRPDLLTTNDTNAALSVFLNIGNAVPGAPTLDPIADQVAAQVPTTLTVPLSGISTGGGAGQFATVTASSNDPAQVAAPVVTYTSPSSVGSLTLAVNGPATITVTVSNGQATNGSFSRSFRVVRGLAAAGPAASKAAFVLYPNPVAGGQCWVQVAGGRAATLRLFDATGRLVHTQPLPAGTGPAAVQLPVGLAPGTYVASLDTGPETYRQRLTLLP